MIFQKSIKKIAIASMCLLIVVSSNTFIGAEANDFISNCLTVSAETVEQQYEDLKYIINSNNTITITECANTATEITVPKEIDGNSVTSIGVGAFNNCSNLTSIYIPNSITYIEDFAFYGCSGLTSIDIPNSVISISYGAFSGCSNLTMINVDKDNSYFTSIDGVMFNKDMTQILAYPPNKISSTKYNIPNSVTSIGDFAFYGCSNLTSIDIPNSVTSIETGAFENCSSLTSIDIANSVTYIEDFAFYGCSNLTTIDIPNSVTSIRASAFYLCADLKMINVDKDNMNYTSTDGILFNKDATKILCYPAGKTNTEYIIPNSVTSIEYDVFYYCSNLTSINIPDSVTFIGYSAFNYCSNLKMINVDKDNMNYTSTDGILFNKHATKIICYPVGKTTTEYIIPNSVTSIEYESFYNCSNLNSVTIQNSSLDISDSDLGYYCDSQYHKVKIDDFTIIGIDGSLAEQYANVNSFKFQEIGTVETIQGDLNSNGKIDVSDLVSIAKYIVGSNTLSTSEVQLADMNGDGEINVIDLVAIAKAIINV